MNKMWGAGFGTVSGKAGPVVQGWEARTHLRTLNMFSPEAVETSQGDGGVFIR